MTRHASRSWTGREDRVTGQLRTRIAHLAAKLIAEGLTDYHAAKLKAARQLNSNDTKCLPDNLEIETALREHLALFAGETQPEALAALRRVALRAMRWLQIEGQRHSPSENSQDRERDSDHTFEPWLTGAVLNGTANEFSEIELELVGVEAKTVEFMLLNRGVEFELREPKEGNTKSPIAGAGQPRTGTKTLQYHLEFEDAPLVITLYENHTRRQAYHPRDSIRHDRASLVEATAKFAAENSKP